MTSADDARPHVLILVQNLTVPFDRRVWQEARTLVAGGHDVTVISPKSREHPASEEVLEGVRLYRYASPIEGRGLLGLAAEYAIAMTAHLRLAWKAHRRRPLDVIQACNPPDLLFLVALPFVLLRGTRFVFDHHDVSPELLLAKGYAPDSRVLKIALLLERWTFRWSTMSIATNDSYRDVAITRGGMDPDDVVVVRSGADVSRFKDLTPDPSLRRGKQHLVAYVGVMGIQEGIDYLLDAAQVLVRDMGRTDVQITLAGSGPELSRLVERCTQMGLDDHVVFLGRVSDEVLTSLLATCDVCVNPDEYNQMNDMSTMNKIMDYMAVSKPIVQFDVKEGRVSAGDSSLYVKVNDAQALAEGIRELLDDPERRARMGASGHERLHASLTWDHQAPALLAAYARVLDRPRRRLPRSARSLQSARKSLASRSDE